MYKNILIATDGSELANAALRHALQLAKSLGAKVTVATVTPPLSVEGIREMGASGKTEEHDKAAAFDASAILKAASRDAAEATVSCDTLHLIDPQPASAVVTAAKRAGCDLIVVGSPHHHGLVRFFMGDEAERVARRTTLPIVIYHGA